MTLRALANTLRRARAVAEHEAKSVDVVGPRDFQHGIAKGLGEAYVLVEAARVAYTAGRRREDQKTPRARLERMRRAVREALHCVIQGQRTRAVAYLQKALGISIEGSE